MLEPVVTEAANPRGDLRRSARNEGANRRGRVWGSAAIALLADDIVIASLVLRFSESLETARNV